MTDLLEQLLAAGRDRDIALSAPGREGLTYRGLRDLVARTETVLRANGIGKGDRVAMVLPEGPEFAAALVAIASATTAAPLNPAYRADEFRFNFSDLGIKALVLARDADSPARSVAASQGIEILELAAGKPAGNFDILARNTADGAMSLASGGENETALVLHTSGTTARPKIVPLSQGNLCASASHIRTSLALTRHDRCLNLMPLFHVHGLVAAVLASLAAGAEVSCPPGGFNALGFFPALKQARPTWYTAVPSMLQAILKRAGRNREILASARLRFVRSSSAALSPSVLAALEAVFQVPVVEAYGMTEAAHQMTSNPLPPGHPGTVGLAAGPEVAVMDARGTLLPTGNRGEVVIRGANVMAGYESNPTANEEAFTNGWFRTGDQGVIDADGYLSLTGRLKEIINRGGEKVSPREVDDVLMEHPAIDQAVTFALLHPTLGEDVAAAIVPRAELVPDEIREFASRRLAAYKVPRKIVVVDEIPKGPTGKLQRIGLAEKLGLV